MADATMYRFCVHKTSIDVFIYIIYVRSTRIYTICFPYISYTDEREKKRLDCRENMKAVGKLLCSA